MILSQAAKIIRQDVLNTKTKFNGAFENNCQQESVLESLKTFIGMILGGADIQTQSINMVEAQTTLSISQLIVFNSTKRRRSSEKSPSLYHSAEREPPLVVYLGMMTHAETRKKALVDDLYHLGSSISYDRVLEISTQMGNNVYALYESEEVVCPPKLNKKVFTTAAVDNIDHNPSSSTAQGSFHGTGISLFQHPEEDDIGEERAPVIVANANTKRLAQLPDSYTTVPAVVLPKSEPPVPPIQGLSVGSCHEMPCSLRHRIQVAG